MEKMPVAADNTICLAKILEFKEKNPTAKGRGMSIIVCIIHNYKNMFVNSAVTKEKSRTSSKKAAKK
jgi:hypothetical protein